MLEFYKVSEALEWLKKNTGRDWTESEFFNASIEHHVTLHGATGSQVRARYCTFVEGKGFQFIPGAGFPNDEKWAFAILDANNIRQVSSSGATLAEDAHGYGNKGVHQWMFPEPVRVELTDVVIGREQIAQLLARWQSVNIEAGTMPGAAHQKTKVPSNLVEIPQNKIRKAGVGGAK